MSDFDSMDEGQLHLGAACFEYDELTPKVGCRGPSINTFLGAWKHWTAKLTSFYSNQPLDCFHVAMCNNHL